MKIGSQANNRKNVHVSKSNSGHSPSNGKRWREIQCGSAECKKEQPIRCGEKPPNECPKCHQPFPKGGYREPTTTDPR